MRVTSLIATATATLLAVAHGAAASQDTAAPARNGAILFSSDQVAGPPNLLAAEAFAVRRNGSETKDLTMTAGVDELAAALSPDGSMLATLRPDGSERVELVVASADGGRAPVKTALPGHTPVLEWAPGSASLAVAVRAVEGRSDVYVVDLDGSRRVVVSARQNTVTGLSWSPDGRRLAYAIGGAGVYVVAADGSGRRRLEATGTGVDIGGLSWSPRGTWIAYVTETVTGATRLSLASLDGRRRRLAEGVTSSRRAWAPTGATVAVPARGGLLLAQPDGRTRRIAVAGLLRGLAWSPDGGAIAFARGAATNMDETVGILDLRSRRVTTVARQRSADVVGRPSWSPNGMTLVYLSKVLAADSELLAVNPDGTGLRVLTHNDVDDRQPAASPDGSTIAFARGGPDGGIFLIDADGGNLRRVSRGGTDPTWSPDGKQLAFARVDTVNPARTHVYVRSLAGNAERRLPGPGARIAYMQPADGARVGYTSHPAWSPSGREIAFAGTVSGTTDVFAVHPDGTGLRRVTPRVASQDHFWPEWSSSGKLAYVTGDFADRPSLWVRFGGRTWQDVTPSFATRPAWSPDGALLVLGSVGPRRIAVVVAADGRQTPIPGLAGVVDPDWQPAN